MAKTMLVTGASRGIGAAVARLAAARGYQVAVNYHRSEGAANEVVAAIKEAGGTAVAIRADVARPDEVARLFAETEAALGTPDVLVNNAGIIGGVREIENVDEALLSDVFAANVFSAFYCASEAVKRMSTRHGGKGGVILNLSSAAARHGGLPQESHYAASKGAIDSFTVGLAKEVGKCGIRVNALRPGLITTEMHDAHGGVAKIAELAPSVPIGRAGTVEEIAEAVLWLASDGASYVHGAILDVSGGR
jgi:NAD(P)-dependent dehydrogenase (short-subunit alcohol dehydrogenase family)